MIRTLVASSCLLVLSACPWDHPTPPEPGQKLAYVLVDNGDPWFDNEATAMTRELRARGFTTYLTGEKDGQARPLDALNEAVALAQKDDRIVIDVQTHGGDVFGYLKNEMNVPVWTSFGFGSKYFAFNPGAYYPTGLDLFATHGMAVFDRKTELSDWLTPASFRAPVRAMLDKGAKVAIFDHSCNGGATLSYFAVADPSVCVVTTAGAMGPGLTGWPALSSTMRTLANADQAAKWISQTIYDDQHHHGGRLHQLGYATGCKETLPVREMLDPATYGFGTWWHWMRLDATHVLREPTRYATASEAQDPTQVDWHPDAAIADGWVTWLMDGLAQVERSAQVMTGDEKASLRAKLTVVQQEVLAYKRSVETLRAQVQAQSISHASGAFSLDAFLREAITGQCICNATSGDAFWADFVTHKDCNGRRARSTSNALVQARPSLMPTSALCSDPRAYADRVLAAYPTVKAAYDALRAQETKTQQAAIAATRVMEAPEKRCVSPQCAAFHF